MSCVEGGDEESYGYLRMEAKYLDEYRNEEKSVCA